MSTTRENCLHKRHPSMEHNFKKAAIQCNFDLFNEHVDHLDCIITPSGNTILHIHVSFASQLSSEFIKQAVSNCPKLLSQGNCDGDTPLHVAAKHGHALAVEELIRQAEAMHKIEAVREMIRKVNKNKDTAVHLAARNGTGLDVVKAILRKEDPEFKYAANSSGKTPLHLAIDNNCTEIVSELLNHFSSKSLDLENSDSDGETLLHKAVKLWDTDTVRILLEKRSSLGRKKDNTEGWTPLHHAAKRGCSSIVATLLDNDKTVAYIADDVQNCTALHIAALHGFNHVMNEIISRCPDCCKLTDKIGRNVLHYSVLSKNDQVLKAILENSSLVSLIIEKDVGGNTPVHLFKTLYPELPAFIVDGDTDSFILWKTLYYDIPPNFSTKDLVNRMHYYQNLMAIKADEELNNRKSQHEYVTTFFDKPMVDNSLNVRGRKLEILNKKREEMVIHKSEKAKDFHLVAAALVALVTFAAAFTLPDGGYIAMALSTSSVFIFITVMSGLGQKYYRLLRTAFRFIFLAIGAIVLAFVTGIYAVLALSLVFTTFTCVVGLSFFLFMFYMLTRLIYGCPCSDDDEDKDGRSLILSMLSYGGLWLKDYIKRAFVSSINGLLKEESESRTCA